MKNEERMLNPIEQQREREKAVSFSDKWEEELRQKLIDEANNTVSEEAKEIIESQTNYHMPHPEREWDVTIDEEIKYFDPELSYEITGYRPITEEKGLDFDPEPFREMAKLYNLTGKYTEYPKDCKPYRDFWNNEFKKCQEGVTIGRYRITGDHYFFLNYYRMYTILEGNKSGVGRSESFPGFLAKQYEFFHYVEMCEKLHLDVCILKARGIGLSEIVAALAVRPYTTNRGYNVLLTCAQSDKLTPLKNKVWHQLDWLNMNTNGGMRHLRQKVNNSDTKRASLATPDGIEYGWMSQINSIVADSSDKIRGDRLDRLIYEECGSNKLLTDSWIKGDALVALGGEHFGTRIALGCVCSGTKVYNGRGELCNIEDINQDTDIIGFNGSYGNREPVTYLQPEGYKECVHIKTTLGGEIKCSTDHPLMVLVKTEEPENWYCTFKRAGDIAVNDTLLMSTNIGMFGDTHEPNAYQIGYKGLAFPREAWLWNKESVCQFIRGLFDSNKGAFVESQATINLKEYSEQLQYLLLKLGVNSYIENGILFIDDKQGSNIYSNIPFRLSDNGKGKYFVNKTINNIQGAKVKSVEDIGVNRIYNLTANITHTYITNRFISANTGGDVEAVKGLSDMFYSPEAYNILPYKNYDVENGKPELTAFFIPAHKFALVSKYLDNRGVTKQAEFKKYYEAKRSKLKDQDFLKECAEHCFNPREALSKYNDNVFDAAAIAERMVQINVHRQYTKPVPMELLWDQTAGEKLTKVKAVPSPSSHLLVVEPPKLDENGVPYKNLYVAGIDAIDMGRSDSATDRDVSDFCVVVKKRAWGLEDPRYVAMYKYRPNDIRQAYDLTMKLLVWYNCKALLEYTKISIQTYFRDKNMSHLFMSRPQFAITGKVKPNKKLIGVPATNAVINHQLELISNFINDYWHTIDYEEMLDQMLNYSIEFKRKFDIIAALGMAELGDEDMSGLTPVKSMQTNKQFGDIGYYVDERGYKRYGAIPKW